MKFYVLALYRPSSNLFCLGTVADSEEGVGYDFFASSPHSDNSLGQPQLPVPLGWLVSVAQSLLRCPNTYLVSRGTPIALGNRVQCRRREVPESWSHKQQKT